MTNPIYTTMEEAAEAFRAQFATVAEGLRNDQLVEAGYVDEDCDNEWVINDPEVINQTEAPDYDQTITALAEIPQAEFDAAIANQALQVHNIALPKAGLDGKCPHCGKSTADGDSRRVTEFSEMSPGSQNSTTQQFTCNVCAGEWGPVVDKPKRARAPSGSSNGLKIEANRETRNGVTRPSIGGKCRGVWDMLDEIGLGATAKDARARAAELGFDKTTCMVQFYRWRKFNGIEGRQ
jgi:hypothetical protein